MNKKYRKGYNQAIRDMGVWLKIAMKDSHQTNQSVKQGRCDKLTEDETNACSSSEVKTDGLDLKIEYCKTCGEILICAKCDRELIVGNSTKSEPKACGKQIDYPEIKCGDTFGGDVCLCDECQQDIKQPASDVVIERAGNITKHGHEAIKAICGTDEEYKAYVKKYSEDGICPRCKKHKIRCYAEAMYFNPEDYCRCKKDTKNELSEETLQEIKEAKKRIESGDYLTAEEFEEGINDANQDKENQNG